jgi:energy-coupling factor transporter ATP-binding protein EcfA2
MSESFESPTTEPLFGAEEESGAVRVPLAPMIDIVFLLVGFFMLTAQIVGDERDLTVQLPEVSHRHASDESPRRPHQLSGGEARRLSLARAIAIEPDWLLLDEPLTNLDDPSRASMLALLTDLRRRTGAGVIIATHRAEDALALASRIAIMRNGAIAQHAPPADVYANLIDLHAARLLGPAVELHLDRRSVTPPRRPDRGEGELPQVEPARAQPVEQSTSQQSPERAKAAHDSHTGLESISPESRPANQHIINGQIPAAPIIRPEHVRFITRDQGACTLIARTPDHRAIIEVPGKHEPQLLPGVEADRAIPTGARGVLEPHLDEP